MDKVIKDGKVAVLISSGFGAGWSTWNTEHPECMFDPDIVSYLLDKPYDKPADMAELPFDFKERYSEDFYEGGFEQLSIYWVPEGAKFIIDEYDGHESLRMAEEIDWIEA